MTTFAPIQHEPERKYELGAVLALTLSLSSFVIWFLPAIVAIFMGRAAKKNIAASNGYRQGKAMATIAQIVSLLSLIITSSLLALFALN